MTDADRDRPLPSGQTCPSGTLEPGTTREKMISMGTSPDPTTRTVARLGDPGYDADLAVAAEFASVVEVIDEITRLEKYDLTDPETIAYNLSSGLGPEGCTEVAAARLRVLAAARDYIPAHAWEISVREPTGGFYPGPG